jgi:hypothetical protein
MTVNLTLSNKLIRNSPEKDFLLEEIVFEKVKMSLIDSQYNSLLNLSG